MASPREFNRNARPLTEKEATLLKLEAGEDKATTYGRRLVEAVKRLDVAGGALLVENDADVNFLDDNDMTPLHHAAARGARPFIRLLVATGKCDYLRRDSRGRYASDLSIEGARDYAVARLLGRKQVQQAFAQNRAPYVLHGMPEPVLP